MGGILGFPNLSKVWLVIRVSKSFKEAGIAPGRPNGINFAIMDTATGGLTVVNAPQTTTTSNVKQGDTVISELTVDNVGQMYFQDAMMSSMPSLR